MRLTFWIFSGIPLWVSKPFDHALTSRIPVLAAMMIPLDSTYLEHRILVVLPSPHRRQFL